MKSTLLAYRKPMLMHLLTPVGEPDLKIGQNNSGSQVTIDEADVEQLLTKSRNPAAGPLVTLLRPLTITMLNH